MDNPLLEASLQPGKRITHAEFGEGVVLEAPRNGYVRVFFGSGERQLPLSSVTPQLSRNERIIHNVSGTWERLRQLWLVHEAHALPLMESAAALTAAKIDLLPHQVVLTHRIATNSPRRYLIADEVGLGKTIETALLLRELASRSELNRALMVVPAGLVNNWHRELNEVFNLNFEVFGSEGDVFDRKSNAFEKHDNLIVSIDTLKRTSRIKKLLDAPTWDLVVFDEAHHLNAYKSGNRVRKTENYKLAEKLKDHTRDLILLSATPHQGDHFRFWMLTNLLDSTLFKNPDDMVENRHRLNTIVFRRTKADACRPDGSTLFARRQVETESFTMADEEREFYTKLCQYLQDGFDLAKQQGNQARALGFIMAIFQKIAASSFAAVRLTLRRRLLMLTIHEAILRDQELDIDNRERLLDEARYLIRQMYQLPENAMGQGECDRILAEAKLAILKKIDDGELEIGSDAYSGEINASQAEAAAVSFVKIALPEERDRINALLESFPVARETKVEKLMIALGNLWKQNPTEKIVIFATYLGTVDLLAAEIETTYPGQGVVVLRGGDHGSKLAAERKFRQKNGPRVLICTAAGREGINLQFARVLFNFDLPWNPMDIEQRIGRIHRYGQNHTAQVYNLVLSDTIEGKIFLLLEEKLEEIAKAVGKVDEHGKVAEDLKAQILGQLSERLSYEKLYQQALSDPTLKRTQHELANALSNAAEARKVVFELFQDLEGFNIDDYKPFADVSASLDRIIRFLSAALEDQKQSVVRIGDSLFELRGDQGTKLLRFTTNRELACENETLDLMGLDHPVMEQALQKWQNVVPEELGASVIGDDEMPAVLTWWLIEVLGQRGEQQFVLKSLATNPNGKRLPTLERKGIDVLMQAPAVPNWEVKERQRLLHEYLEPMLNRELKQQGLAQAERAFSTQLIGWVEVQGKTKRQPRAQRAGEPVAPYTTDETFGQVIFQARKAKGLSQRELADSVGLNFTYLSKLENDKADYPPKEDAIRAIARILELDEEELIYLAGRLPESEEQFLKQHYDKMPALFKKMQEDPDFAEKVFEEAQSSP
ncbi:MAG: SNF2-related protein [Spirulina sp.]